MSLLLALGTPWNLVKHYFECVCEGVCGYVQVYAFKQMREERPAFGVASQHTFGSWLAKSKPGKWAFLWEVLWTMLLLLWMSQLPAHQPLAPGLRLTNPRDLGLPLMPPPASYGNTQPPDLCESVPLINLFSYTSTIPCWFCLWRMIHVPKYTWMPSHMEKDCKHPLQNKKQRKVLTFQSIPFLLQDKDIV